MGEMLKCGPAVHSHQLYSQSTGLCGAHPAGGPASCRSGVSSTSPCRPGAEGREPPCRPWPRHADRCRLMLSSPDMAAAVRDRSMHAGQLVSCGGGWAPRLITDTHATVTGGRDAVLPSVHMVSWTPRCVANVSTFKGVATENKTEQQ